MNAIKLNVSDKNILDKIFSLDLTPIKNRIKNPKVGLGWSDEKIDLVEKQYKAFLYLSYFNSDKILVPTNDIDDMWHTHILDTNKYIKDSNDIFGKYLHHYPYLWLRWEEDISLWNKSFNETKTLFKELWIDIVHEVACCWNGVEVACCWSWVDAACCWSGVEAACCWSGVKI